MVDTNQLLAKAQAAQSEGKLSLALQHYQQVLLQHPNELSLQIMCGNLCVELLQFEEAAGHFRRVLASNKSPDARNALCYALQALGNNADKDGQYVLAEACFEEVLQHQPNNAAYWYNLGNAQRELGKLKSALASFQQSIDLKAEDADSYNNLGNVQRELGQLDLAIDSYKAALKTSPDLHHALAHLVHQKQHICDWQGEGYDSLSHQISTIRGWVKTNFEAQIPPFAFLAMPSTTAQEQKSCASNYVQQNYAHLFKVREMLGFTYTNQTKPKINIGYLSADFRLHPLASLIAEVIESHDRTQFEITAYSYGANDKTPTRKRLEVAFDHFTDIRNLNDIEAAKRINADQIDILIDLTGFTQSSRTGLVALKPAPICINWLGYPGTMGEFSGEDRGRLEDENREKTPLFDYLITDKTISPIADDYSENLIYLPCYQPNNKRSIGNTTLKSDHHLPEDSFVFCSFNQTFKISAEMFALWMRLLKQVPNSVLWLLECNQWAKVNLQKEAALAGIEENRLVFAPRTNSEAHLERQQHADLFLDTLPYNAHTTASDAMWMGLPVLTCMGDTFPARVAASLLQAIVLPELVCDSLIAYEKKALLLAKHSQELDRIKTILKDKKESSNLFNAAQFTHALEMQYHAIWKTRLLEAGISA